MGIDRFPGGSEQAYGMVPLRGLSMPWIPCDGRQVYAGTTNGTLVQMILYLQFHIASVEDASFHQWLVEPDDVMVNGNKERSSSGMPQLAVPKTTSLWSNKSGILRPGLTDWLGSFTSYRGTSFGSSGSVQCRCTIRGEEVLNLNVRSPTCRKHRCISPSLLHSNLGEMSIYPLGHRICPDELNRT